MKRYLLFAGDGIEPIGTALGLSLKELQTTTVDSFKSEENMEEGVKAVVPNKWPELTIAYWGVLDESIIEPIEPPNKSKSILKTVFTARYISANQKETGRVFWDIFGRITSIVYDDGSVDDSQPLGVIDINDINIDTLNIISV